jgi:TorA maturation chaperone TorD
MIMEPDRKNVLKGYNLLLYFAGSMIMDEPTEECIIDFWKNGKLRDMPVSSSNPRFLKASELLRNSCPDKIHYRNALLDDFFRLFAVSGLPLAPAFASIYITRNREGLKSSEKVTEFYEAYGWQSRSRTKIPDDHLGIELLFLTRLIDKYMMLDDEPCSFEMRKEIKRYIDQHLLSWVPEWNKDIQEHAHTRCYKGIGTLIYASIEDLYGLLS